MRYSLQEKLDGEWLDMDIQRSTKSQIEEYIGQERVDYEWRCGYTFKPWGSPCCRWVWNNTGEEVNT